MATGIDGVAWYKCCMVSPAEITNLELCVCAVFIWVLPEFLPQLLEAGVSRVVALSSSSVFTKQDSLDMSERRLSQKIADAENNFMQWAQVHGIEWVILRPTLIYGSGADKNIAVIAKFIKRFGFFSLYGKGSGLRQPVHVLDVASARVSALRQQGAKGMDFSLSGAETLTYREMISRVFIVCGLKPRLLALPIFFVSLRFFRPEAHAPLPSLVSGNGASDEPRSDMRPLTGRVCVGVQPPGVHTRAQRSACRIDTLRGERLHTWYSIPSGFRSHVHQQR